MNLCKDCAHFRRSFFPYPYVCARPLSGEQEPVYGGPAKPLYKSCHQERGRSWRGFVNPKPACGPSGIYFEAAPPKQTEKA